MLSMIEVFLRFISSYCLRRLMVWLITSTSRRSFCSISWACLRLVYLRRAMLMYNSHSTSIRTVAANRISSSIRRLSTSTWLPYISSFWRMSVASLRNVVSICMPRSTAHRCDTESV